MLTRMITIFRGASTYLYNSYISIHKLPNTPTPTQLFRPPKMTATTLFTLPILFSTTNTPCGSIVCTSPSPGVYLLTFTSQPDNRLLTGFCQAFLLALDIIEFSYPPGVVITTSGITKFYSNGLDLEHAVSTEGYWPNSLFALWKRLLTCALFHAAGHEFD
jgi:hypothetical protein